MVNFKDLQPISPQASAGQGARMQALQVAVAGELDKDAQKLGLIKQAISSGVPLVGEYLQRKAGRDDGKRQIEQNKAFGKSYSDYLGLDSPMSEAEKFGGLEFSGENQIGQTADGKYKLGAEAAPPVNPKSLALRNLFEQGFYTPQQMQEIKQVLEESGDLTTVGTTNKYTSQNTKSEYESLEGAPGTGTSRRNVARDVDINKGKADIANTYDTMAKRVAGGSAAAKKAAAGSGLVATWGSLQDSLRDINKDSWSGTRAGAGLFSKISGGNVGGDLGNKVDAYATLKDMVGIELASAAQPGNLTKQEQQRAINLLPDPGQSIKRQEEQYRAFASYINGKAGYEMLAPTTDLSGRAQSSASSAPNQGSQPTQRSDDAFRFKE